MKLLAAPFLAPGLAALLSAVGADIQNPTWWMPLANMGGIGVMLIWFMFRHEPRMKAVEAAMDRSSRTDLLRLIASPHVAPEVKDEATAIMKEIDAAERDRGKKL